MLFMLKIHAIWDLFIILFQLYKALFNSKAVFNWVSKVIRNCFGFALLRYVIGLKNSRHLLNQSDAKPKPIARLGRTRFPALGSRLRGLVCCDWPL